MIVFQKFIIIFLTVLQMKFGFSYNDLDIQTLYTTEAFYTEYWLNKSVTDQNVSNLEMIASVSGHPDLPNWMTFYRRKKSAVGYFYGTPPAEDDGDLDIEIIILDTYSFNTTKDWLKYRIHGRTDLFKYEVEMKFFELDLQDFFQLNLLPTIRQIFQFKLWKGSNDVYITKVARPIQVGGRFPLDPKEKEGVVVRIGSVSNFTVDILRLESETKLIKNRTPCPKRYKATSAEYLFREKLLYVDWCSFKLRTVSGQ